MEQTLGQEYFDNLLEAREGSKEALELLVQSTYFSHVALFFGEVWDTLRERSLAIISCDNDWYDLVRPALFLSIMEIPDIQWKHLWDDTQLRFANILYRYLMNATRREIETFLLDGLTLEQELFRDEAELPVIEWDSDDDEFDNVVPESMISPDNTEEQALNNILIQEIKDSLSDMEWIILTNDWGNDTLLAQELGLSGSNAVKQRRKRIREKIQKEFEL